MKVHSRALELILTLPFLLFWCSVAGLCGLIGLIALPYSLPFWGGSRGYKIFVNKLADHAWMWVVWNVEVWGGWRFKFSGDKIPPRESAIVLANHRFFLDWVMIFSLAARKGMLGAVKLFVKDSIFWVPGVGWALYILDFIFLRRNWSKDSQSIEKAFHNLKRYKLPFWLVSHPEGTRYTPYKVKSSQEFSKKKNFPLFQHVLVPHTKGLVSTIQSFQATGLVDHLYDITIMYNDGHSLPNLSSLVLGGFFDPSTVNIHVRRFALESIPKDEEGIINWTMNMWDEKNKLIEEFHKRGKFPDQTEEPLQFLYLTPV